MPPCGHYYSLGVYRRRKPLTYQNNLLFEFSSERRHTDVKDDDWQLMEKKCMEEGSFDESNETWSQ